MGPENVPASALGDTVRAPMIWSEKDRYCLSGNLKAPHGFVPRRTVMRIPDGSHRVGHEKPVLAKHSVRKSSERNVKRILVADDDNLTLELIQHILRAPDVELTLARDGREALAQIRQKHFDLVLTDIQMPQMDGLELLTRVKELRPSLKVIVMTGYNTPENVAASIKSQAFDYVAKPFAVEYLVDLVKTALEATAREIEVLVAQPNWVELRVPCDLAVAHRVQHFLREVEADLDSDVRDAVGIAFRELLTNAIEHGGQFDPAQKVTICYIRLKRMILYRISDPGRGFRFDELAHAAIMNPSEDPTRHLDVRAEKGMRGGGFGILLARNVVDELIYNETQNEVLFVKYLDSPK